MSLPKFLTAAQVAETLQMTTAQAYELMKKLPAGVTVKLGRRVRANEAALAEWLAAGGHIS